MNRRRIAAAVIVATVAAATVAAAQARPAPAAQARAAGRFLYVARAPKDRNGFRGLKSSLEVHDIDAGHKLVRVIPLPETVFAVRGLCASAATGRLYVAHYGRFGGKADPRTGYSAPGGGRLLCLDLATDRVLWDRACPPSADRMAVTPDGKKIYFPAGEERKERFWTVIDGRSGDPLARIDLHAKPHNTVCSLDGRWAFLQGFGDEEQPLKDPKTKAPAPDRNPGDALTHENGFLTDEERSIGVVDTRTDKLVRRVGPFRERTRPFTVSGDASLVFATVNDWIGFQVGDVKTGQVLHTVRIPENDADGTPLRHPAPTDNATFCHGIALTADEKEVWVVDQKNIGLHVFDASGLPEKAPTWVKFVKTRTGRPDIFGQPGWIMASIDGRYLYPETGEIIDAREKRVVGQLTGADGKPTHSRFAIEVDLGPDGRAVRVGDQFAVGRHHAASPQEARR